MSQTFTSNSPDSKKCLSYRVCITNCRPKRPVLLWLYRLVKLLLPVFLDPAVHRTLCHPLFLTENW